MEICYCEADFLIIIVVDIWRGIEHESALRDKIDKLLQISTIKWIRLFNGPILCKLWQIDAQQIDHLWHSHAQQM